MEAIAKHDFNATADDELSFRKMQILKVNCSAKFETSAGVYLRLLGLSVGRIRWEWSPGVGDCPGLLLHRSYFGNIPVFPPCVTHSVFCDTVRRGCARAHENSLFGTPSSQTCLTMALCVFFPDPEHGGRHELVPGRAGREGGPHTQQLH